MLVDLFNPEWGEVSRVHDWRNHIPKDVKSAWDTLSIEARYIAYYNAEISADQEEWD